MKKMCKNGVMDGGQLVSQEGQRNYKEEVRADVKKIQSGKAVCPHDKPVKVWEMSGREDTVLESEDA